MLPETLGIHVGHVIPSILSRVISRARSVKLRYNKTVSPILQTMVACLSHEFQQLYYFVALF